MANTDDKTGDPQQEAVHIFHHSFRKGGGMERYALAISGGFVELGHKVVFHAYAADVALAKTRNIQLDVLPVRRFPRKLRDFRFFRRIEAQRPQIDGLQIALSRVRSRDLVICGGTHRGYMHHARKIAGPFDWLQIWMERQAYAHARVVISHSQLCSDELVKLYRVPREKIITLHPPVEFGNLADTDARSRAASRNKLGLPPDKVVFLFPSTGHSRKGLKPICHALAGNSDRLVLAVAGKPPSQKKWPFVHYLGYLDNMADAYRAADFTILGSNYEPFGMVGPESVLCGTRLVFEEKIGCLPAINPDAVITFSVGSLDSIRGAVAKALALAEQQQHHLSNEVGILRYDPSADTHVRALLRAAAR